MVDPAKWNHFLALMVQATFFSQQNVSLTFLPAEEAVQGRLAVDHVEGPHATTASRASKDPKLVRYVSPSATGAVLHPGEALWLSFLYSDRGNRLLKLTPTDVFRWQEAARALHDMCGDPEDPIVLIDALSPDLKGSLSLGGNMSESLRRFQTAMTTLIETTTVLRRESFLFVLLVTLSFLYGGLHLAAWSNSFPSSMECMLWKISCLIMMGMLPLAIGVWFVCSKTVRMFKLTFVNYLKVLRMTELLSLVLISPYGCARMLVIVEAFISMRKQPIGVFWSPEWLQTVPHF